MKSFPTINDVNELISQEEDKENLKNISQHMQFSINIQLSENARIEEVALDIAKEYPEIPRDLCKQIAAMEEPIKGCHEDYEMFYEDELRIYRLFNILQTIKDPSGDLPYKYHKNIRYFSDIYTKSLKDIKETYNNFLENFTYANPGEQKVSKIMKLIKEYTQDAEIIIPEY